MGRTNKRRYVNFFRTKFHQRIYFSASYLKKRFYPIDKSVYKKPYAPLMLTSSKYGAPNYGTKYFRDESNPQEMMGGVSEDNYFD